MYRLSYFKETDQDRLSQFLSDYPFAFLTGSFHSGKQVATQIPMLTEVRNGELYVQGHIMRQTDHHKALTENPQALIVFTGPNAYVSASWYSNPQMGSTWNYMSVYLNGTIHFMSDAELIQLMKKLTLKFEQGNIDSPTIYDQLPTEYLKKMMPAIVGIEMKVDKIDNVFKLSQNRDETSYQHIIEKLEEQGGSSALVAHEMQKRKAALFPTDETP